MFLISVTVVEFDFNNNFVSITWIWMFLISVTVVEFDFNNNFISITANIFIVCK